MASISATIWKLLRKNRGGSYLTSPGGRGLNFSGTVMGHYQFFVIAMQNSQCLIAIKLWISTAVHGQAITPTGSKSLEENNDLFIFVQGISFSFRSVE